LSVRQKMSFRGRGRQLEPKTYNHSVLHRKETHRVRCSSKRSHIQSAIFHQSQISRFENSKPEFSAPEDRVNFLGAHESFHVPSRIESYVKNYEELHFQNATRTRFTRYKPARILALWDVKADPERSRVFLE
jgi:5-methylcytosine-specific restriction endonuclease McrA